MRLLRTQLVTVSVQQGHQSTHRSVLIHVLVTKLRRAGVNMLSAEALSTVSLVVNRVYRYNERTVISIVIYSTTQSLSQSAN